MNKIPKIAVSFLLILSIILNPFASALDIRARAAVQFIPFLLEFIKYAAEGFIIGTSAYLAGAAADEIIKANESLERAQNNAVVAVSSGVGVYLSVGDSNSGEIITNPDGSLSYLRPYHVSAELGYGYDELSDEEKEFADFFVNYINSNNISVYGFGDTSSDSLGNVDITVEGYEKLRNEVATAYNEYATKKLAEETMLEGFRNMVDAGVYPEYEFSLGGSVPHFMLPSSTANVSIVKDGFVHIPPVSNSIFQSNGRFPTAELAQSYEKFFDYFVVNGTDLDGYSFTAYYTGYSGGYYIIYDGKPYYAVDYRYSSKAYSRSCGLGPVSVENFVNWYTADGVQLSSVYVDGDDYSVGIYYNKTGEVALAYPQVTTIDDSEFTTTTGGGTVEIPRTEEEDIIGQALGLGLINPDSALEFNEDGTIAGADGLTLAKLQELIDMIAEGKLDFESIQEYLDLITRLVSSGNYTATEQAALLENIEAVNQASAKSLEEINAAVLAISESFTIDTDSEISAPVIDDVVVSSGGFTEAYQLIEVALPVVNQCKDLIFNLMDWNDNQQNPPNFSFYWDSNKDGEVEKYTVLDLSFMEQTLTNDNLEDKGRFANPMTIREFVQSLIVLITYAVFAVKILRKIPSVIGGSEGSSDDINTGRMFLGEPEDYRR